VDRSLHLFLSSPQEKRDGQCVQVRPISNDEGNKLLQIARRSSGSVVTWRRAQMVLLSAPGATDTRPHGVRHLLAGYDLSTDRLYGHVKARKGRTEFLAFCRYLRSLHPTGVRIAFVLDNFSPHLSTKTDSRVGDWAAANNVELAYVPSYGSWLDRIETQFSALHFFALDGTDHDSHREQASMSVATAPGGTGTSPIPSSAESSDEPRPSRVPRLPDSALGSGVTGALEAAVNKPAVGSRPS
jgi:hypothetical protein